MGPEKLLQKLAYITVLKGVFEVIEGMPLAAAGEALLTVGTDLAQRAGATEDEFVDVARALYRRVAQAKMHAAAQEPRTGTYN